MVGEGEVCKITDFGMARDVQEEDIYVRTHEVFKNLFAFSIPRSVKSCNTVILMSETNKKRVYANVYAFLTAVYYSLLGYQ